MTSPIIQQAAPAKLKIVGDFNQVEELKVMDPEQAGALKDMINSFAGLDPKEVASNIRAQNDAFQLFLDLSPEEGEKLAKKAKTEWAPLRASIVDAVQETLALAAYVESTGTLPIDKYLNQIRHMGGAESLMLLDM